MKKLRMLAIFAALLAAVYWSVAQVANRRPLAELTPRGALVYLEAEDFSALLKQWNASQERPVWLASDNYQVFSRSALFLRLNDAQQEFATAAGVAPDMALLDSVAGSESAIALYDIGKLEFLYITRLPSARVAESALWKLRGSYEARNALGFPYYVRIDKTSRRLAAFASAQDYLLLATREDLIAGALTLLAGQAGASVRQEPWFDSAVRAARAPGELRLAMNLDRLVRTPHFRSYWIQQNVSDLSRFAAGIVDLRQSSSGFQEDRILLRREPSGAKTTAEPAVAELLRMVPATAGFYRAWAQPSAGEIAGLVGRKILAPQSGLTVRRRVAPTASADAEVIGSQSDLEVRIDEAPLDSSGGETNFEDLEKLFAGQNIASLLQVESTRSLPDGVFVGTECAFVLLGASGWDANALRNSLAAAAANFYTTGKLGAGWVERRNASLIYQELDGLARVSLAVNGRVAVIANHPRILASVLGAPAASATGAVYAAGYRHARELGNFIRMTRLLDHPLAPQVTGQQQADARQPLFFSENMGSLGRTLTRVESASIVVHDPGPLLSQTVVYKLK